MNDWFEWNGVRCTEHGIHVLELPMPTIPAERVTFTDVPGRSGALAALEGVDVYDDLTLTASCYIADPTRIPEIATYLRGSGNVTFANRQGGFYRGRIINQIPFERILRGNPGCSFAVNFRCRPFWYQADVPMETITESMQFITNPGTIHSEPVITVYGSGEATLMVGQYIVELAEFEPSITLDSELQEAYSGVVSMNNSVSGDFPLLLPGVNAVSWSGDITKVEIQPNWRYL